MSRSRQASNRAVLLLAACALVPAGCRDKPLREMTPAPTPPPVALAPPPARELPAPRPEELKAVVKRVFGDAAAGVPAGRARYIVGDFNGDLSQDIAVVVRPAPGKLDDLNTEYPRWMLKDPFVREEPGAQRLRVAAGEELLAVVHGDGPDGWRNPDATQAYLLKNAVARDMKMHGGEAFVAANRGHKIPRIHGDVIAAALGGAAGYLYYNGAGYAWYDPRTFTGEPPPAIVHGRPKTAAAQGPAMGGPPATSR